MELVLFFAVVALGFSNPHHIMERDHARWELFKVEHDKEYEMEEEVLRKGIFLNNLKFIREHNAKHENGKVNYSLAMNVFADMTGKEFSQLMNGLIIPPGYKRDGTLFNIEKRKTQKLPNTVDWRKRGAVTPVKEQLQCNACWAFSATGSLEGQHFRKYKKLVSLSEQNLVDCTKQEGNQGCQGGLMDHAFKYVKKNKGIDTENGYPYTGKDGTCRYNPKKKGATDSGYVRIPAGNEKALQMAIAKVGPVSAAIDASRGSFQFYNGGVLDDETCSSMELNHGMLVVGYGQSKKAGPYYILKNSWGTRWGLKGYMLLARNNNNMCGIASLASYPKI